MERENATESGSAADVLMSLKSVASRSPLEPTPTNAAEITHPTDMTQRPDYAAEAENATNPCNAKFAGDILASLQASNTRHRQFENDFLQLPHDRALSKETAFQILTQRTGPTAPCRASASPIDRRTRFFYVTSSKLPGSGRGPDDSSNDISVSFQSIANSQFWWSDHVHDGNRLGIVARHMSRRTRVQGKAAMDSPSALFEGNGNDLHGFQGRWFCLVQAPCLLIGESPAKLKLAKAVPGAYSLVQVWRAPGSENANSQLGKRKYASPPSISSEQYTSQLYCAYQRARLEAALMTGNRAREERIGEADQPPLPPALQRPNVLTAPPLTQNMQLLARYPFFSQSMAPNTAEELFRPRLEGRSYSQDRLLELLPCHQQPVQPSNQATHLGLGPSHTAARKQALRAPVQDNHHFAASEFRRSCSGGGGGGGGNSPWPHGTISLGCSSGVGSSFGQVSPTSSSTAMQPGALGAVAAIAAECEIHPRIYTYSKADEEDSQGSQSGEGAEEFDEEKRIAPSPSCSPPSPPYPPPPLPPPYLFSPSSSSSSSSTGTAAAAAAPSLQPLPAGSPCGAAPNNSVPIDTKRNQQTDEDEREEEEEGGECGEEALETSSATIRGVLNGATPPAAQPLPDATGLQQEVQSLTQTVSGLLDQLRKEQEARKQAERLLATHMVQQRLQQQQQQQQLQQQEHQRQHNEPVRREHQFFSTQSPQPPQQRQQQDVTLQRQYVHLRDHQHQLQLQTSQLLQLQQQQYRHQQQQQAQRQSTPYNYLVGTVQNPLANSTAGARFSFF